MLQNIPQALKIRNSSPLSLLELRGTHIDDALIFIIMNQVIEYKEIASCFQFLHLILARLKGLLYFVRLSTGLLIKGGGATSVATEG